MAMNKSKVEELKSEEMKHRAASTLKPFILLTLLLCVSLSLRSAAQLNPGSSIFTAGVLKPAASGGATTLLSETFEGAGYQVATTETGTGIDEDDATSSPEGSQNLKTPQSGGGYAYPTAGWTPNAVITITGWIRVDTVGGNNQWLEINATANGTPRGYLWTDTAGRVTIYGNGAGSVSVSTNTASMSANTWYKYRAKWNKTTGLYSVEYNTSGTFDDAGTDYAAAADGDTGVTIGGLKYDVTAVGYTTFHDAVVVTTP